MKAIRESILPFVAVFAAAATFFLVVERRIDSQSTRARIVTVRATSVLSGLRGADAKTDSVIQVADDLLAKGDGRAAAALLLRLAAESPDTLRGALWFRAGQHLLDAGEDSLASAAFANAVGSRKSPRDAELWLAISRGGSGQAGRDGLERVLSTWPDYAPGWFRLGVVQSRSGDTAAAAVSWRKALEIFPDYKEAKFNLADLAMRQGRWKEAQQGFAELAKSYPWKAEYHFNLARCHSQAGKRREAVLAYHQAIDRRGGNYPEAWRNLALVFRDLMLEDSSRLAIVKAVALRPGYPEALYDLGMLHLAAERMDSAGSAFAAAARSRPAYKEAWYNLGVALARRDRDDSAVGAYRRALAIDPGYRKARIGLAIRLAGIDRHQEALVVYREGIRRDPTDAEYWFGAGLALRRLDSLPQAVEAYRKTLSLDPDNDKAINNLGLTLAKSNRRKEAADVLRDGLSRFPDNVSMRFNLALQEARLGNGPVALGLLDQVRNLDRRHSGAYRLTGEILSNQGRREEARAMYVKSLELEPGNLDAMKAVAEIPKP